MAVGRATRLFFDASCLFTAADSPHGGSAYLLSVCARGYLRAVVSPDILVEAERNVLEKLPTEGFRRYRHLLTSTPMLLAAAPSEPLVRQYQSTFREDAHVVAAALAFGAQFLITLDQRLERRVNQAQLPIVALSPAEFLQTVLTNHSQLDEIRREL